ncbi:hypothetical protein B0H10DRAFT_1941634 [Mycena sp. CBHHK59/15]|nr:hypothetical protein B0H10DRAFT_1941634 [Mycena sp. CBHHK59/15]
MSAFSRILYPFRLRFAGLSCGWHAGGGTHSIRDPAIPRGFGTAHYPKGITMGRNYQLDSRLALPNKLCCTREIEALDQQKKIKIGIYVNQTRRRTAGRLDLRCNFEIKSSRAPWSRGARPSDVDSKAQRHRSDAVDDGEGCRVGVRTRGVSAAPSCIYSNKFPSFCFGGDSEARSRRSNLDRHN